MAQQRRTVNFRGHVQGVGFRFTTCQVAKRFTITGTVCNLDDGSVRLVAEGADRELDRFISAVEEAMDGRIRERSHELGDATGEFDGFSTVYH